MTEREQFEAWIKRPPFEHECDTKAAGSAWPGKYRRYETELAWASWQARAEIAKTEESK